VAPRREQGWHRQQHGEPQPQRPKPEAESPTQQIGDAPGILSPRNLQVVQVRRGQTIAACRHRRLTVPIGQGLHALLGHEHRQRILIYEVGRHFPLLQALSQFPGIAAQRGIAGQKIVGRKGSHHDMREH
jgi:hypothetical protein